MSDKHYHYTTKFNLQYEVIDFEAAKHYLTEDNMTHYLKDELDYLSDKVEDQSNLSVPSSDSIDSITWNLRTPWSGTIDLVTNEPLGEKQLKTISNWVGGQNSDGLGEGFEQQDFAEYFDEESYEMDGGDENDEINSNDYYIMASFDWRNNDYIFEKVK